MKKIICFVVGLLFLSSFAAINTGAEAGNKQILSINFEKPIIKESAVESYVELDVEGTNRYLHHEGEPVLPIYTETLKFPFGTKIKKVICTPNEIQTIELAHKIVPTPKPQIIGTVTKTIEYTQSSKVYDQNTYYPENWCKYFTAGGLDENSEHKTFLTIHSYPIRYNAVQNILSYATELTIEIEYEIPEVPILQTNADFDLVIITPSKLYDNSLQALIEHKNNKGMRTYIKTTNEIYDEYTGGDHAEQIKYFIKDAIETHGIKYVMLVGGLDSLIWAKPRDSLSIGDQDWHLPARYNNMRYETGQTADPGYITDLYFADIYDSEGNFESWDPNGDGIYAQWTRWPTDRDVLDFLPDVYVGRLPCRNVWEVKIMTNKIMNYENQAYGADWFNTFIVVGGDSFHDPEEILEGEFTSDNILEKYMTEFDPVKIYASYKTSNPSFTPTAENIVRELSKGAGHIFFDGHANPGSWNTHWPGENKWTGGIQVDDFMVISNKDKYPICNVEGCHNSQFNVSAIGTLLDKDNSQKTWCYGNIVAECWSWHLARKINGGSLATIGNTGLGYGATGESGDLDGDGNNEPDIVEALGGYFFGQIYKTIDEGVDILGEVWGGGVLKYIETFPPMDDQLDAKEMEQLALIGDPSLKIGGYPSTSKTVRIIGDDTGFPNDNIEELAQVSGESTYTYKWDLDEDGQYDDHTGSEVEVQFDTPGIYLLGVKATNNAETLTYSKIIEIKKDLPEKPTINGPKSISGADNTEFSFTGIDPNDDELVYLIDWGDETYDIIGPKQSGEPITASHRWTLKGVYTIKVKTFDSFAGESPWSNPHIVSITKSKQISMPVLQIILENLLQRYPNVFQLLQQILGI